MAKTENDKSDSDLNIRSTESADEAHLQMKPGCDNNDDDIINSLVASVIKAEPTDEESSELENQVCASDYKLSVSVKTEPLDYTDNEEHLNDENNSQSEENDDATNTGFSDYMKAEPMGSSDDCSDFSSHIKPEPMDASDNESNDASEDVYPPVETVLKVEHDDENGASELDDLKQPTNTEDSAEDKDLENEASASHQDFSEPVNDSALWPSSPSTDGKSQKSDSYQAIVDKIKKRFKDAPRLGAPLPTNSADDEGDDVGDKSQEGKNKVVKCVICYETLLGPVSEHVYKHKVQNQN